MVTAAQIKFFDQCLEEREFPPSAPSPDVMREQFSKLSKGTASDWIDKVVKLPKKGEGAGETTVAPF